MKEKLIRFLTSYKAAILCMAVYAVLMAVATFVEKEAGTDTAKALIYYSPLFILLHLLMILNFIGISWKRKLFTFRKWGYAAVHLSFIVILTGAMITHLFSKEGMMHLREGERGNTILVKQGPSQTEEILPFEVELLDFKLTRYPGSQSPSSYESTLKLYVDGASFEKRVFMNHVLDLKGFRFFQASYDPDELGSILSVSYDVTGRTVTYFGYSLLFLGLLGCFFGKGSRFRRLCQQLQTLRSIAVLCLLGASATLSAQPIQIAESHAEKFGLLPMQDFHGRIIPVNTFASELSRKLHWKETMEGLNEDQLLLGLIVEPAIWAHTPLIPVEDKEIRERFTQGKEIISYREAFTPQGEYRFGAEVESAYQKSPALRSHLDRELLKLDEKINLLHQLFNYRLLRIFPVPGDSVFHHWMAAGDEQEKLKEGEAEKMLTLFKNYRMEVLNASQSGKWKVADQALKEIQEYQQAHLSGLQLDTDRLEAEVKYNRQNLLPEIRKGYLIAGGILLVLSFLAWFNPKQNAPTRLIKFVSLAAVLACFGLHTYCLGMRWYISGHAPWSNSYETMVFLAWAATLGGFCFMKRSATAFALSTLFGGVVLFVSGLSWMDPEITPLVPVLKSPWLMFHVATLMMAYGFMGISCMMGTTNLIASALMTTKNSKDLSHHILRLSIINELSLCIGLALMTVGIFLGAIWANESWGRYWSWDPKETWALITAVIYAVVLHLRWFEKVPNHFRFNLLSQISFLAVLMTYFGVNYLLSGMHSYGNTNGLAGLPTIVFVLFPVFFILPGLAAYWKKRQGKVL